jgi:Flp pilus assembly protein TadG
MQPPLLRLGGKPGGPSRRQRRSGNSIIEFAFIAPWFLLLFIGSFDLGLYSYALISVENGARVAAIYCGTSGAIASSCQSTPTTTFCSLALAQVANLPNAPSTCVSPIAVSAAYSATGGPDSGPEVTVTVQYTMPALPLIPGSGGNNLLPGQYTVVRRVEVRTPD